MRKLIVILLFCCLFLTACNSGLQPQPTQLSPLPPTPTVAVTDTPAPTIEPSLTSTFTLTPEPSFTFTPTISETPTITFTPTFTFPSVVVKAQAHCRYGPSTAYLHAADLYPGDAGTVRGRFRYSNWLYIKFDKLNYFCWVAPSVVDVSGDITIVNYTEPNLQSIGSNQYGPPKNVKATRNGNMVTITWDQVVMTGDKDRGYFIEAWVCQNGAYLWWTASMADQFTTTYTVQDDPGCPAPSSGVLLTVEKHGYSQPVTIPWPPNP